MESSDSLSQMLFLDLRKPHMIEVFIEVMKKIFVQSCNSQGCGMFVAKTVFLLTQQLAFGKIIVEVVMRQDRRRDDLLGFKSFECQGLWSSFRIRF